MEEVTHNCGVGAVYLKREYDERELVPDLLYSLGFDQTHRGQQACGFVTYNPVVRGDGPLLKPKKVSGKPNELFCADDPKERKRIAREYKGIAGIVHTRYATTEVTSDRLIFQRSTQPVLREHNRLSKEFAFAFNGTFANYQELKRSLMKGGEYHFKTGSDTEVGVALISKLINEYVGEHKGDQVDMVEVSKRFMEQVDGGYTIVMLFSDGNMIAMKGKEAIRPGSWGKNKNLYAIASESFPLERIGIKKEEIQDLAGGSVLSINRDGHRIDKLFDEHSAHCFFEWVYFAKVLSQINGKSVYTTRASLGENLSVPLELWKKIRENPCRYVVVPSPMTAIAAAEAFANKSGVSYRQAIIKMEGLRGFINTPIMRYVIMGREYGVIKQIVNGKMVLLVDDTKVRGETSERTAKMLFDSGAEEVHEFLTAPPIICPCYYGIDMATHGDLIARRNFSTNKQILERRVAKEIGVNSVTYQTHEGLYSALGFSEDQLCTACITGKYPTPAGQKLAEKDFKKFLKGKRKKK